MFAMIIVSLLRPQTAARLADAELFPTDPVSSHAQAAEVFGELHHHCG
jgi:hypothetical protein